MRRLFQELKRRNVYRVAATYAVVGFVVVQVADLVFPALRIPSWAYRLVVVLVLLGFPVALVLAWAFEMTPEGMRRTPEAEVARAGDAAPDRATSTADSESGRDAEDASRRRSRLAGKVLVALGLLGLAAAGGWYLTGSGGEAPEIGERTVAVPPFHVVGAEAGVPSEGMASLLQMGLDGAVGLRAIPSNTVFATWEERGHRQDRATTDETLAVARAVGGRYGVVGEATQVGSELRLKADLYLTTSGERLDQVTVTGSPDSVTALAEDLTRQVIGALAEGTSVGLRAAGLASMITDSDSALTAFLAGERHLRASEGYAAIDSFEVAIRRDSGFALPYARMAVLGLWHGEFRGGYMERAFELSEKLPERQQRWIRALHTARVERRPVAAADSLRRLTRDFPDDPRIWSSLGELIAHTDIPRGLPEVEEAHERAVALDPGNASYYDHFVGPAFTLHHDSDLAARRVDSVPQPSWRRMYRLGLHVVFGDSAARQRAVAAYDTAGIPGPGAVHLLLGAPEDRELLYEVVKRLSRRDDESGEFRAAFHVQRVRAALEQGQVRKAIEDLGTIRDLGRADSDRMGASFVALAATLGLPMPDSLSARYLDPGNLPADASVDRLAYTGFYLIEEGRTAELEGVIRRMRDSPDRAVLGSGAAEPEPLIRELRGYRALRSGDPRRAEELFSGTNGMSEFGALWRGDLHARLGDARTAEGWYLAAWELAIAHERLGRIYEEMDRPEEAAAAYRRFIAAWEEADPELQPRVDAARERLAALTGEGSDG